MRNAILTLTLPVPEVSSGGDLADQDGEAGQDRAVTPPCSFQLQQAVQVAAEQVELGGLEVLGGLQGAPDTLGDLKEELDLGGHGVELLLPLLLVLVLQQDTNKRWMMGDHRS